MQLNTPKTLVIGRSGQLAQALLILLPEASFLGRPEFDIANPRDYNKINWGEYDYIINASGFTNVDGAETSEGRKQAWLVNATGSRLLAQAALEHEITLVHVSTDYVFDGTEANHQEDEPVSPLNVYGQSKAAGEIAVQMLKKHYLVRTEWLIGSGKNFVRTMLDIGKKGIHPKVVSDQTGRLTFTNTLAAAIMHLTATQSPYGIYHVSNSGPVVSWADIADKIFELSELPSRTERISTAQYLQDKPLAAPRPLHCEFNLNKIITAGFTPPDWQDELKVYLKSLNQTLSIS